MTSRGVDIGFARRPRVLVFPLDSLANYLRCIEVVGRYSDKEVLFAQSDKHDEFVHEAGYGSFPVAHFDTNQVIEQTANLEFEWMAQSELERVLLSQVLAIKAYAPDLVVGDSSPTLKMAAEMAGVPYVSLMNGYMSKYYENARNIPAVHWAHTKFRFIPGKALDRLTRYGEHMTFRKIHLPFQVLRKKYKLNPLRHYLDELEGDYNLICDSQQLFPQRNLPASYEIVGPLFTSLSANRASRLPELNEEKPTIVVSMGREGDWTNVRFLNSHRFSRFNVVTVGDEKGELYAAHVTSLPFVDFDQILPQADIMICHGGNGTIQYGVKHKVFMLCFTNHFEQEWNVQALENNGLGRSINSLGTGEISHLLTTLISENMKTNPGPPWTPAAARIA